MKGGLMIKDIEVVENTIIDSDQDVTNVADLILSVYDTAKRTKRKVRVVVELITLRPEN